MKETLDERFERLGGTDFKVYWYERCFSLGVFIHNEMAGIWTRLVLELIEWGKNND